ncbi:hypothetical protein [Piscirickettsia salmonis]|nr:hypothetical protein [Piscirickettsia salmonis]
MLSTPWLAASVVMTSLSEKIIKPKLGVLELAKQLGIALNE